MIALVRTNPPSVDGKPPPHDLHAEAALLTSMILKPEVVAGVFTIVDPEDFYSEAHRRIAEAVRHLAAEGQPIDALTVDLRLRDTDRMRTLGEGFLIAMMDDVAVIANPSKYAEALRAYAVLRRLALETLRINAECYVPQDDPRRLLERLERVVGELAQALQRGAGVGLGAVARELALVHANPIAPTAPTGIAWLDEQVGGGFRPGQLVYLGARSGSGKSVLACQVAIASVNAGKRVLYASLEMPRDEVLERLACTHGGVNYVARTRNTLSPAASERFNLSVVDLVRGGLLNVADQAVMTVMDLEAVAVARRAEVVIVDYVQLMSGPRGERFNSPRERVESVSRGLKALAMKLKVPVIAPCQLSRASATDNRRPVMTDLREAGGLENDADAVIFVWRPQYTNATALPEERLRGELIVGKLRRLPFGQSTAVRLGASGFEEIL